VEIVLATRNRGKIRELQALLADLPVSLLTLDDYPAIPPLPETGDTFEANATSKAALVARLTGRIAVADDSGLEVDALRGAPGVHSATFLGPLATEADRNAWVLERMRGVEEERRTARFRAVVAVATPDGSARAFEGVCEGRIADVPRGAGGFGYDPIFIVPEYGCTMGELPAESKNAVSHRARAIRAARDHIASLTRAGKRLRDG